MPTVVVTITIVLLSVTLLLILWLIATSAASRREAAGHAASLTHLQRQLETLRAAQDKTSESLQQSLQSGQSSLTAGMQASQQTLTQLHARLGELQGTSKQMLQVGAEVRRLQDILSSPKLRGQMGEWSLETLLANVLPQESYALQHTLRDGKIVDALIQLSDFSVPIDAKFPLPSFQRTLDKNAKPAVNF
jgi:DNA recombination protein RmuC